MLLRLTCKIGHTGDIAGGNIWFGRTPDNIFMASNVNQYGPSAW
ncbi:MAG: hypothetical protein ABL888_20415 [Pirellulaceae bacterium]